MRSPCPFATADDTGSRLITRDCIHPSVAVYTRESHVPAPLSEVWEFHTSVEGVTAVTPDWMRMRVDHVVGPDGEAGVDDLAAGSQVTLSVRPFGVGPRQRSTSRIVECDRAEDGAVLVDQMVDGPFSRWEHTTTSSPRTTGRACANGSTGTSLAGRSAGSGRTSE